MIKFTVLSAAQKKDSMYARTFSFWYHFTRKLRFVHSCVSAALHIFSRIPATILRANYDKYISSARRNLIPSLTLHPCYIIPDRMNSFGRVISAKAKAVSKIVTLVIIWSEFIWIYIYTLLVSLNEAYHALDKQFSILNFRLIVSLEGNCTMQSNNLQFGKYFIVFWKVHNKWCILFHLL